jgi:hypothetical protein
MEQKPKNFSEYLNELNYEKVSDLAGDEPAVDNLLIQDCIDRMTDLEMGPEYKVALKEFNQNWEPKMPTKRFFQ